MKKNAILLMVVSKWEHELDKNRMSRMLNKETEAEAEEPEAVLEGLPETGKRAAAG